MIRTSFGLAIGFADWVFFLFGVFIKRVIVVALDCLVFIFRICCLDLEENLRDLLMSVHDFNKAQFLFLILTHEDDKFTTFLNFVLRIYKFVSKILYPIKILVIYLKKSVANNLLLFSNNVDIWLVFLNCLGSIGLDRF